MPDGTSPGPAASPRDSSPVTEGGIATDCTGYTAEIEYEPHDSGESRAVTGDITDMVPEPADYGPEYRGYILSPATPSEAPADRLVVLPAVFDISRPRSDRPGLVSIGTLVSQTLATD